MKRLFIDIGNSNIVIGKGDGTIEETYRYRTDYKSSDEYYALLKHLFEDVDDAAIASVVPQVNEAFKAFMLRYYDIKPLFVGPGVKTGISVRTDYPQEVGADLVAAAAGAVAGYHSDAIVVDMGTATTFSLVQQGEIKGVSITIGLDAAKQALVENTSQLLQFEFSKPPSVLGTNTIDALNAGFLYGHVYQVIGMVDAIKATYDTDPVVLVTGGAAPHLAPMLPREYRIDEHLVLRGLAEIYKKNR